ncbi:hypothetical protein IWW55_006867, partial [Coemansia sp. RSA 2706]
MYEASSKRDGPERGVAIGWRQRASAPRTALPLRIASFLQCVSVSFANGGTSLRRKPQGGPSSSAV